MKTRILIALTLLVNLCFLQSCSKVTVVENEETKSHVQITVSPFDITMEDMGTATRAAISSAATHLSFAVFNADGTTLIKEINQVSSGLGYGTIDMELSPGTYKMVAVAHNGTNHAVINSVSSVTLPGSTFTDTFSAIKEIKVESGKNYDIAMNLPRATAAFVLKLSDTPPAEAKKINVVVNTAGAETNTLSFDPDTRLAKNTWKQTYTIPIEKFEDEKGVPFYFICMVNGQTVTVEATAYDADNKEIISHTISNVTLKANQKTIAIGNFFVPKVLFSVSNTWEENINIGY